MNWDILVKNFQKRGFKTYLCTDETDVKNTIKKHILSADVDSVGFGNSQTCRDLNIIPFISGEVKDIYIHDPQNYSAETDRKALLSDLFFTSANAVSMDGYIVNIDGTGNRVSATCYGPKHVVYIIGQNKIAEDLDKAIERAKQAAVKNAKRLNRKTPCAVTGKCADCLSSECICGVMSIHRKSLIGNKISILFVKQSLGL